MLSFKTFLKEETEEKEKGSEKGSEMGTAKLSADITSFLDKINMCKTEAGLKELEKYYSSRKKEVDIKAADDITIRDAIAGRREEIESQYEEVEAEAEEV